MTLTFTMGGTIPNCTAAIDMTFADDYGIEVMESGCVALQYSGRSYLLHGAWCWVTHPGPRFRYHRQSGEQWNHHYIRVRGQRVAMWVADGLLPFAPRPVKNGQELGKRIDRIIALSKRASLLSQLSAAHQLEGILLELAVNQANTTRAASWIEQLINRIETTPGAAIDYAEFAAQQGMALVTLRRKFKEITGVPLQTYVIRTRANAARELLETTDLPIKAIADQLGYADVAFFHRQFQQQFGMTPGLFRAQVTHLRSIG